MNKSMSRKTKDVARVMISVKALATYDASVSSETAGRYLDCKKETIELVERETGGRQKREDSGGIGVWPLEGNVD